MGIFIFPFITGVYLGQCFDLVKFQFNPVNPYLGIPLDDYTTTTSINMAMSRFQVVSTPEEMAEFLGLNVISYLKKEYGSWPYYPSRFQLNIPRGNRFKKVTIAVRMNLQKDKETISVHAPKNEDWESKWRYFGGTHYLKSVTYGAEVHSVIEIDSKNRSHFEEIKKRVETEIGSSGNFDEDFEEKLGKLIVEMETWYGIPSTAAWGINSGFYPDLPKLIKLRNNLHGNRSLFTGKTRILYEFHSLSEISSIPSVRAKREFVEKAKRLLMIHEDLEIVRDEILNFYRYTMFNITEEEEDELSELYDEIDSMSQDVAVLVANIDVTTGGDIHQFDNVFLKYGSQNTEKYRNRAEKFIRRAERIH
ncbi:uncharacterized protein LOC111641709 [Centruroides sculpturatus]|uniref:uncharacterized protein LOC111641709 n=1 Tax=Centruroides sculpturatus TaxID=218467 RepID=UPI000C6E90AE|nr:uncharacterized protein LOC111641709 [Centruroides sculpturatus]